MTIFLIRTIVKPKEEVSKKSLPKTVHFKEAIKPNKEKTMFDIQGKGSFQKLEVTAEGSKYSMIALLVDDEMCLEESFDSLSLKSSRYVRRFFVPNPQSPIGRFAIDIDLPRNFFKNLKFSVTNKHENIDLQIKGTVHYNIYGN